MKAFADTFCFLALLSPSDQWHEKAATFLITYSGELVTTDRSDKRWSLTDCISFVVMEQEGRSVDRRPSLRAGRFSRALEISALR